MAMSAFGTKRTCQSLKSMSAFGGKADITSTGLDRHCQSASHTLWKLAGAIRMAEQRVQRRLAAILAGDVAGYSRLMGADEEGTLLRLNAHRREFLEPKIADHRGRIVKRTGDGV